VSNVRVLTADAGFRRGTRGLLDVTTDGSVTVRVGNRTVRLPAGHHLVPFTA
jgi:hypothetical protein